MAALTLGTLATAAAVGAAGGLAAKSMGVGKKKPAGVPLPALPSDEEEKRKARELEQEQMGVLAERARHLFNRSRSKRGRAGTILTGPRGITSGQRSPGGPSDATPWIPMGGTLLGGG